MKIRWYEILVLVMLGLCILIFLGSYFATTQAPGIWISMEYNGTGSAADDTTAEDETAVKDLVDINTADQEELESLPGIGTVKAQAILDYRSSHGPFDSIEDLLKVEGIGEKLLEEIRDYITISKID